jgi:hypothetical protein
VGGVPAKPIKKRFPDETIRRLMALKWWKYNIQEVSELDIKNIQKSIETLENLVTENNISENKLKFRKLSKYVHSWKNNL